MLLKKCAKKGVAGLPLLDTRHSTFFDSWFGMRKLFTRNTLFGASQCYENLSSLKESPSDYTRTDLSLQFIDSLCTFLTWEDYKQNQPHLATDLLGSVSFC